ncbi:MAG: biotin/lipoyl-containing protein [Dokdonella sp.]
MDIQELEQLAQMVRESNVGELTLRHEGQRITIRKSAHAATAVTQFSDADYAYTTDYAEVVDTEADEVIERADPSVLVTAPLVGVFGHVKPLVGLNARVNEGQVVGVIEAMKINTEIKSPATGTIVDIFIEAGHPVEFGQALFEIRTE